MSSSYYTLTENRKIKEYKNTLRTDIQNTRQELVYFFLKPICNIISMYSLNTYKCIGFSLSFDYSLPDLHSVDNIHNCAYNVHDYYRGLCVRCIQY